MTVRQMLFKGYTNIKPTDDTSSREIDATQNVRQRSTAAKPLDNPEYGANNRLVSKDRAAELCAKLKVKLNGSQSTSGLDPDILAKGTELAVFHLEANACKFADFACEMMADLNMPLEKIRSYLRGWYNAGRDIIEDSGESIKGMDSPGTVRAELAKLAGEPAPKGATQSIFTPPGRELLVRPKEVEAADLIASDDDGGTINPAYPS